jgi:ATP-dependent Lon protease
VAPDVVPSTPAESAAPGPTKEAVEAVEPPVPSAPSGPSEQHFTIMYGASGYSYESIVGPYLQGAKAITIEDPYIRLQHQIQNFVRLCETIVRAGSVRTITLITGHDEKTPLVEMAEKLEELKQSLIEVDVELNVKLNPNIHDREIRIDNGWIIKIGRGLDFYQKPNGWFEIGANDMSLRKCLETKVDIYQSPAA